MLNPLIPSGTTQGHNRFPRISMYLGNSKYWWAYLALLSNPDIFGPHPDPDSCAVLFEFLSFIPQIKAEIQSPKTRFYFIFWDGLSNENELLQAQELLGEDAQLEALVVGELPVLPGSRYKVSPLYARGELDFSRVSLTFDDRTRKILTQARLKTLIMPLKNLLQSKGDVWPAARLLVGGKRIVFCGAYGLSPLLLKLCSERHLIDPALFQDFPYYSGYPNPSFETFQAYLRNAGLYLADLFDQGKLTNSFLQTVTHLQGREYFVERMRAEGIDLFVNGYGIGKNLNVNLYTTPFYSQHIFLDFGSQVVGTGNYPRQADLRFFSKEIVNIDLLEKTEAILALARGGRFDSHFDRLWQRNASSILEAAAKLPR